MGLFYRYGREIRSTHIPRGVNCYLPFYIMSYFVGTIEKSINAHDSSWICTDTAGSVLYCFKPKDSFYVNFRSAVYVSNV